MPPSQNQIALSIIGLGVLLGLWAVIFGSNISKKKKEEHYAPWSFRYGDKYHPELGNHFLTGTYSDLTRGETRLDICVNQCKDWLDLPPFEKKVGYCISDCVDHFGHF